jgi:hypothetical protein
MICWDLGKAAEEENHEKFLNNFHGLPLDEPP